MGAFSNFFSKSNSKKVLSFDGGGVRAIAGLVFLHKLEVESGRKVSDMFDMFVGVSAGALNALCLGVNQMSAKEIKGVLLKTQLNQAFLFTFPGGRNS